MSSELPLSLRGLLLRPDLGLRLVGDADALKPDALDQAIRWIHSSDLTDPTPFLSDEVALLTTGTQLDDDTQTLGYVQRLRSRGVVALGFGTEVVRDGVPQTLREACAAEQLPLFEVPYRTPFIAVVRANADAVAAQAFERRSWALGAQRAISNAALKPDGVGAALQELSAQLDAWVGMYDASGELAREHPERGLGHAQYPLLADEVATVLRRQAVAGSALTAEGHPFSVQTLGRGGHLRGALVVAAHERDQEDRGVVASVAAIVGLALEQRQGIARIRGAFGAGLIEALDAGHPDLARRLADAGGAVLPAEPVVVAVAHPQGERDAVIEWLGVNERESVLWGVHDDELVIIVRQQDSSVLRALAERFGITVGTSTAQGYDGFRSARAQARVAQEHGTGLVPFSALRDESVLGTLPERSRILAASILEPLRAHDRDAGTELTRTVRAFLENDGSAEATASVLGVHRHTVRSRMQAAERVLGRPLGAFPARAEIWAAFLAADS